MCQITEKKLGKIQFCNSPAFLSFAHLEEIQWKPKWKLSQKLGFPHLRGGVSRMGEGEKGWRGKRGGRGWGKLFPSSRHQVPAFEVCAIKEREIRLGNEIRAERFSSLAVFLTLFLRGVQASFLNIAFLLFSSFQTCTSLYRGKIFLEHNEI